MRRSFLIVDKVKKIIRGKNDRTALTVIYFFFCKDIFIFVKISIRYVSSSERSRPGLKSRLMLLNSGDFQFY